MQNMDAVEQYQKAFKAAHKEYKELQAAGKNPHPPVLDEILPGGVGSNYQSIGLVEIPSHRIVGTKAAGRPPGLFDLQRLRLHHSGRWLYCNQPSRG